MQPMSHYLPMTSDIRSILARNLRGIMVDRGLTQMELAEMSNMSPRTLASILTGTHSVGPDRVAELSEALGMQFCELLTDMYTESERAKLLRDYDAASTEGKALIRLIAARESATR